MTDKTHGADAVNTEGAYPELKKATPHIIVEIIEYMPNSVVSKTIIKKTTGSITAMSFDMGEELTERRLPFDSFVQVIDGNAEILVDKKLTMLKLGEGMIIPAHSLSMIKANERFKIILSIIKSGYEDLDVRIV